jgi:hypothetical protein
MTQRMLRGAGNLIFSIPAMDADVHWSVQFGPTRRAGYSQTWSGTFAARESIALALPVFGPALLPWSTTAVPSAQRTEQRLIHPRTAPDRLGGHRPQESASNTNRGARVGRGTIRCRFQCVKPSRTGHQRTACDGEQPPTEGRQNGEDEGATRLSMLGSSGRRECVGVASSPARMGPYADLSPGCCWVVGSHSAVTFTPPGGAVPVRQARSPSDPGR